MFNRSRTLYVDVDNTLVFWFDADDQSSDGQDSGSRRWEVNTPLVVAVKEWMDTYPDSITAIWSGGGHGYARTWMERVFPPSEGDYYRRMLALSKNIHVPQEHDVCVDDQDIRVQGQLFSPEEFVGCGRGIIEETH